MNQHEATPPLMRRMFDLFEKRESPYSYVRMSTYGMVSTMLGRKVYMPYGCRLLYPNLYVVLVGEPATRKSTVINTCRRMLQAAGHVAFSPTHLSRSRLIQGLAANAFGKPNAVSARLALDSAADMTKIYSSASKMQELAAKAAQSASKQVEFRKLYSAESITESVDLNEVDSEEGIDDVLDSLTNAPNSLSMYLDELVDGASKKDGELWTSVTNLWDCNPYTDTAGTVIPKPCLNMLSGINPASFVRVFPVNEMQSGLITRILLTHGSRTGRVCAPFDIDPDASLDCELDIIQELQRIGTLEGEMAFDNEAKATMRRIMVHQPKLHDHRFTYYYDRRLDQLTKMCMGHAAMWGRMTITRQDVLFCNTALTANDWRMSDALGAYGLNPVVRVADMLLRELRDYAQSPAGLADGGGVSRHSLYSRVQASLPNKVEFANALAHLTTSGLATMSGDLYYANVTTLNELRGDDGRLFDSSMCIEWDTM